MLGEGIISRYFNIDLYRSMDGHINLAVYKSFKSDQDQQQHQCSVNVSRNKLFPFLICS